MIAYKLICDNCLFAHKGFAVFLRFSKKQIRLSATEEGWRRHNLRDLCPECAIKVLGPIGVASSALVMKHENH